MLTSKPCAECGEEFTGRSNRRYCSSRCRKRIEYRRRQWDTLNRHVNDPHACDELLPGVPATLPERVQMRRWIDELKSNLGERP